MEIASSVVARTASEFTHLKENNLQDRLSDIMSKLRTLMFTLNILKAVSMMFWLFLAV